MKPLRLGTAILAASAVCLSAKDDPATGAKTEDGRGCFSLMRKHFDRVLTVGTDQCGEDRCDAVDGMGLLFLLLLDLESGRAPDMMGFGV